MSYKKLIPEMKLPISCLDKYEEGNWTPTMRGVDVNYSMRIGRYTRIGNVVFYSCNLRGTINSVITPDASFALIDGLPYHVHYPNFAGSVYEHYNCLAADTTNVLVRAEAKYIGLQNENKSGGTSASKWVAGLGKFYLAVSGFYFTTNWLND